MFTNASIARPRQRACDCPTCRLFYPCQPSCCNLYTICHFLLRSTRYIPALISNEWVPVAFVSCCLSGSAWARSAPWERGDTFAHVASNVARRFLIKCLFISTSATELDLKLSSKAVLRSSLPALLLISIMTIINERMYNFNGWGQARAGGTWKM